MYVPYVPHARADVVTERERERGKVGKSEREQGQWAREGEKTIHS